jgi:hypothetical protein
MQLPNFSVEHLHIHLPAFPTGSANNVIEPATESIKTTAANQAQQPRFELSADENYVIDHKTGLMWARDESKRSDYDDAEAYCKSLRLGGFNDWRLPTLDELQTIVDRSRYNPAIDASVFNTNGSWTWTCDEYKGNPGPSGSVWFVHFDYGGSVSGSDRANAAFARAVRAVPAGQ